MFVQTTGTKKIIAMNKRIRAVPGGTSASKTISILLYLIALCQRDKAPTLTSVVAESIPALKKGAIRDFKKIMMEHNYWKDSRWMETDKIYTFETGSQMEFFGADQHEKLRGGRRDRLFINEANNIAFMAFEELEVRTKEFVFIDWNPTNEFWYYTELKGKRDDIEELTLTYLDNEALPDQIRQSIEARKNRKGWWKVYGLGQLGEVEGKIYKDWQIIDELPHEARLERFGLDFGYSCLSGETLIATSKGNKRIDKIIKGDYVLTRKGYRKVLDSWSNGIKNVYNVDFGYGKHIIVTGDHRIFTKDGWKRIDELNKTEIICEMKSCLMGNSTDDTQTGSTQNIFSLLIKKVVFIGIFILNIMVRFLKVIISIILTVIRLITVLIILLHFLSQIILKNIITILKQVLHLFLRKKCWKYIKDLDSEKTIGMIEEKKVWKQRISVLKNVLNVEILLKKLATHIKNIAVLNVIKERIQGIARRNIFVKIVENFFMRHLILKENHVLRSVQISLQLLKEKIEVFDLTVEDEHEFFANGILMHNCDPTSIVAIYKYNGGFIFDEICYQKGMTNKQIADTLDSCEKALVIADSAEPKSIDEIKSYGINIQPSIKGQGSVLQGIQFVQEQKCSVTKRSVHVIKDYRNYLWMTDKDGKIINEPEHQFSHSMDCIRYGLSSYKPKEDKDDDYKRLSQAYSDSLMDKPQYPSIDSIFDEPLVI